MEMQMANLFQNLCEHINDTRIRILALQSGFTEVKWQ
jgi:hypothetical protein